MWPIGGSSCDENDETLNFQAFDMLPIKTGIFIHWYP